MVSLGHRSGLKSAIYPRETASSISLLPAAGDRRAFPRARGAFAAKAPQAPIGCSRETCSVSAAAATDRPCPRHAVYQHLASIRIQSLSTVGHVSLRSAESVNLHLQD